MTLLCCTPGTRISVVKGFLITVMLEQKFYSRKLYILLLTKSTDGGPVAFPVKKG
jgi:hypothetical protein